MKDKVWDFIVSPEGFATRSSEKLTNVTLWASSLLGRLGGPGSFMDVVLNAQIAGNAMASKGAYIQGDLFAMMANDTVALYLATRNILTRISMQSCREGIPPQESVELLASLSDSLSKAVASSKKILPETDRLATALEVVQRLGAFIKERHPAQYAPFLEVLEGFAKELEDNFS
ncbi:DUF1804 family protein [Escherichia coli]